MLPDDFSSTGTHTKDQKLNYQKSSVIHKNPQRNTYYTLCYIMDLHCGKCGQF